MITIGLGEDSAVVHQEGSLVEDSQEGLPVVVVLVEVGKREGTYDLESWVFDFQ